MEGAVLSCSFGTSESELKVPVSHGPILQGKNQATIADHVGNVNIMTFGQCTKKDPPCPCNPSVSLKWINGKKIISLGEKWHLSIPASPAVCRAALLKSYIPDKRNKRKPKMSSITYANLKTNIDCIQQIRSVRVVQRMNEHGRLFLTGILN